MNCEWQVRGMEKINLRIGHKAQLPSFVILEIQLGVFSIENMLHEIFGIDRLVDVDAINHLARLNSRRISA